MPYTESLAYQDWAPYSYLDGFYDDPSTGGFNNQRAVLKHEGVSKVLDVLLPEGCVTSACAMQTKSALITPVDSATLKFKCAPPLLASPATFAALLCASDRSLYGVRATLLRDAQPARVVCACWLTHAHASAG